MLTISSYPLAVFLCFISMICWGSWANTKKLWPPARPFREYYRDYTIGAVLFMTVVAFTAGSTGSAGRPFAEDLAQAGTGALASAFVGGVVQNVSNILIVYSIDIAGIAVAFPIGVGLGFMVGVIQNYIATPVGDPVFLFGGFALAAVAIGLNALAHHLRAGATNKTPVLGIILSVGAGILGGFYYRFIAATIMPDFSAPGPGLLTPYTALWVFSLGIAASTFLGYPLLKWDPGKAAPVQEMDLQKEGIASLRGSYSGKSRTPVTGIWSFDKLRTSRFSIRELIFLKSIHLAGISGGIILGLGTLLNFIAAGPAGYPISFSLGQGAAMVGAFWGVFIWKEFRGCPKYIDVMLGFMFALFIAGLLLIAAARVVP